MGRSQKGMSGIFGVIFKCAGHSKPSVISGRPGGQEAGSFELLLKPKYFNSGRVGGIGGTFSASTQNPSGIGGNWGGGGGGLDRTRWASATVFRYWGLDMALLLQLRYFSVVIPGACIISLLIPDSVSS